MDIDAIRAALGEPLPVAGPSLQQALDDLMHAAHRQMLAEAEQTYSRRPSTLKATLKSTRALERARGHLMAELQLITAMTVSERDALRVLICAQRAATDAA